MVEFGAPQGDADAVVVAMRIFALALVVAQVVTGGKGVLHGYFKHESPNGMRGHPLSLTLHRGALDRTRDTAQVSREWRSATIIRGGSARFQSFAGFKVSRLRATAKTGARAKAKAPHCQRQTNRGRPRRTEEKLGAGCDNINAYWGWRCGNNRRNGRDRAGDGISGQGYMTGTNLVVDGGRSCG